MADEQYQDTEDQVALPDTSPDWSISKALQDYANPAAPAWSPENSSLNMLLDKNQVHDIAGSGNATGNSGTAPQPDGGIYTGLQPYVPDPHGPVGGGINGKNYTPQPGDSGILARLIMAEGASTSQDMPALGWAVVNRVGNREFGQTLDQVAHQKNAFQSVQDDSGLWPQSTNPESFAGPDAKAWQQSQATAQGILSGTIPDPTGGATLFFSSDHYNPADSKTAPRGWYPGAIERGDVVPSPSYPSTSDRIAGNRNYFFVENPYRK